MKKNILLLVSGLVSALLVLVAIYGTYSLCSNNESCVTLLHLSFLHLLILFPVFIFSLVTYFLSDGVFTAWYKFTRIYIPICIGLILITPEYGTGSFIYRIEKGSVAFYTSLLYFGISVIIILTKLYTSRAKKQ